MQSRSKKAQVAGSPPTEGATLFHRATYGRKKVKKKKEKKIGNLTWEIQKVAECDLKKQRRGRVAWDNHSGEISKGQKSAHRL